MVVKLAYAITVRHCNLHLPALQVHDRKVLQEQCARIAAMWEMVFKSQSVWRDFLQAAHKAGSEVVAGTAKNYDALKEHINALVPQHFIVSVLKHASP
jgi:hypothetical protein